MTIRFIDRVYTGPEGGLWVGHRLYGAFHYDGKAWTHYGVQDGLADNSVRSILQTDDGSVWAATPKGISRFDGRTWTTHALTQDLTSRFSRLLLRGSRDRALWIRKGSWGWSLRAYPGSSPLKDEDNGLLTIRYDPDADPPETEITLSLKEVSQPGNTTLAWKGADPWRDTPTGEIQYAWRLDSGEWSAFSHEKSHIFELLPSGKHRFEVKARDRDFNEDLTPAAVTFTVVPPVYREPWFIAMVIVFVAAVGIQTGRVVRRDRVLRESNAALSTANRDLFGLNRELQRDRAVERVRAEVTSMKSADDLRGVVEDMLKELSEAGVAFDLCVINIVDEEAGLRRQYGATKQGWSGQAEMPLSDVSEQFMAIYKGHESVVREVDDALAETCLRTRNQLGVTEPLERPTATVDAPFVYGTLSLQTHSPGGFPEQDVALVEEFARVVALGYARFMDFQNLEAWNRELQRDRAVEHIRAHVQSMEQASDFERVLSLVSEDLKMVGLSFDACGIDVLSEPVDNPSMAYFEEHGYRCTAYKLDPAGRLAQESYYLAAPFPDVNREMIERFIAGQPWLGRSGQTAIVEVPISGYGRLRLTASDRQEFTEEDIDALRDFASAIALGYSRYLDFWQLEDRNRALAAANREIQEATQRKSAFLASMSHELRTPITAIKGFTSLVLRRIGDSIPERHRDNLSKVMQASDHLLGMINDLLDLSKIEAGRMDVNAEPFDVKALVASCCATVGPLAAEKPDVKLSYDVPDDVGEANTDGARLRQVLINLLSNAIKFTDSGSVTVRSRREDGQMVIAVADTGKGIPAGEIGTIFDEYQQVKGSDREHKGTGLGLSITKRLTELLGGTVSVESEVGKGSTFTVRAPMVYGES